ncbi:MAG: TonB-dependent receptor plug domain-containing protein [Chryseolinea sp.]
MKLFILLPLLVTCLSAKAQIPVGGSTVPSDTVQLLQEVTVTGENEVSERLRGQPVNVAVINAMPFYKTNATALDLLRQVSGIKIKQSGGFGGRTDFFINGSTGKQVKFFIDGLPQDNLGETQMLNVYPVEQIERIEVYKGVLPVDLGADALGAAINIVTRKETEDYVDGSYSIASFNTHRLNVSGRKYLSDHFFVGAMANINYAENGYRIEAEVPNEVGNVEVKNVRRFHDVYKNYNAKLQAGIIGTAYADQLVLSVLTTGLYDQIQNNLLQAQAYGSAFYKERLVTGSMRYQKENLIRHFDLSSFLSFNRVHGLFMDTSRNVYSWEGKIVDRKYGGGEIGSSGHALHLYNHVVNGKITGAYHFTDNIKLVFSNTFQRYYRTGRDTVAQKFYGGLDYYGSPSTLVKNIAGLGLEGNFFQSRLKFSSAIKSYTTRLSGYEIEWQTQTNSSESMHAFAYNTALSYSLNGRFIMKASYEHAARLPEAEEALGDMMLIKPNPRIQIETSDNINLNVLYNHREIDGGLTTFFRDVTNIIYLRTAQNGSQYQNLLSARVWGIEGSVKYRPVPAFNVNANFTYQDLRNQSVIKGNGINNDRYKNARLPNIPYLFMNGGVSWKRNNVLTKNTVLQVWWNTNYTHEYFLYWEVDGAKELKNRIPAQLLHHTGISYAVGGRGLSFAFEVNNITNAQSYDNFRVQLPGRSCSFKVRFYSYKKEKTT